MLAYLLLGLAQLVGLLLIPFSPVGIWLQLGSLGLFGWWSDFELIGPVPLLILFAVALTAELIELPLAAGRIERTMRRRLGIGSLIGAAAGAAAGIALPLLGTMFGALLGGTLTTTIAALTHRPEGIGCAALGGQAIAVGIRSAAAVAIATFTVLTLSR
ncbi:MAG TPA: hypothetical protein VMN39_08955 [Longimicrobiaceae bacterium]|nr:hypothetical protein [Longimicrobiaceae bacterium]